jgi:hypothetical protein
MDQSRVRREGKEEARKKRKKREMEREEDRKKSPQKYLRTNCPTRCDSASSWISLLQGVRGIARDQVARCTVLASRTALYPTEPPGSKISTIHTLNTVCHAA